MPGVIHPLRLALVVASLAFLAVGALTILAAIVAPAGREGRSAALNGADPDGLRPLTDALIGRLRHRLGCE